MISTRSIEMTGELALLQKRATRLEWITFGYTSCVAILMYLVMGNSQAMKSAWVEDLLSIIPSASFLLAHYTFQRPATRRFPYGMHTVFSSANMVGAVALTGIGLFIFLDSALNLIRMQRPSIGAVPWGNGDLWLGWLMIAVLVVTTIPIIFLGRLKQPLAEKIHNKILYTDADTQKADWVTASAAVLGITGIGFGLWWADAVAALVISFAVLKDGVLRLKDAFFDTLNQTPRDIQRSQEEDPLVQKVEQFLLGHPWIADYELRLRDEGQISFGEVMFVPKDKTNLDWKCRELRQQLFELDWRIQDMVVMPTDELRPKPKSFAA